MLQDCQGFAPRLDEGAQAKLRLALLASRSVLASCYSTLQDSRTGEDLLPLLLQARTLSPYPVPEYSHQQRKRNALVH